MGQLTSTSDFPKSDESLLKVSGLELEILYLKDSNLFYNPSV